LQLIGKTSFSSSTSAQGCFYVEFSPLVCGWLLLCFQVVFAACC